MSVASRSHGGDVNETPRAGARIVIDGPAGSGKSTLARELAKRLHALYLDTGSMYRLATARLLELGIDLNDQEVCARCVEQMRFAPTTDPKSQAAIVDDRDFGDAIRSQAISTEVSKVATNLLIRKIMVDIQRTILAEARAAGKLIVSEGRDLTTVVAPDAEVRILVTADPEVRVQRRLAQLEDVSEEEVRAAVVGRDAKDAQVVNFFDPAPGVNLLDTSEMGIEEAVAAAQEIINVNLA